MTHSGGKEHKGGDRGQRYEVTYFSSGENKRKVFGWSETLEGVQAMHESINLHPTMTSPETRDRNA